MNFIYADDVAVCAASRSPSEKALAAWKYQLALGGSVLSVAKTQYMVLNYPWENDGPISIGGQLIS